jgi:hypothetical protein
MKARTQHTVKEMAKEVQVYALDHYNEGGWDSIVECWGKEEIIEEIANYIPNPTMAKVLRYFKESCKVWDDQRKDVQATIW